MAARRPFVSCNESIPPLLLADRDLAPITEDFVFGVGDARGLAERIAFWIDMDAGERERRTSLLRDLVVREHDVDRLMARLVTIMVESRGAHA